MAEYGAPFDMDDKGIRLLNAINSNEETAYSSDGDGDLSKDCASNIDRYLGRNIFPAPEGRSQARDRSTYEVVNQIVPSLSRIFANGDDVVELPPIGPEDEQGAKQEAQFLNHILLQRNNWFDIFDTAVKDALLTKRGYLHAYVEMRRQIELESYKAQTPESLALIMQDKPEVIKAREYPDPDYVPQPQPIIGPDGQPIIDPQTGQPAMQMPPPQMLYDVEIRRNKPERHFCIEVFPPERCKVAESTKTVQLRDCAYFEYYDFPTISELREMGLEIDDDMGSTDAADTQEDTARDQYQPRAWENQLSIDPAQKRVKCRWVWVRHDYDDDGISELQFCIIVGSKILHREEVNRIPVAVLCPDKLPHRHIGLCPADTVAEIEEINTAILRNGLDNLYLSNNPIKYADGTKVNLDDVMVSRPGSTWRLKPGAVMGQNFGVMPIPFVFPQAMEALAYMDSVKEKRVGVGNNFQGLDASQLSQLQPGTVNQISSMAAQRTEQIARHIANGVTELMCILHELVLKSGHKKEVVQLRGQWVEVDPSTWRKRTDFRPSVGYSAGNKDAQIARLQMVANMQKEAMAGGLSVVNEENIYETMNELIKVSDLQAPQRFITHPSKAPPKQPPQPDVTVMAMETIKAQTTEKVKGAEIQSEEKIKAHELQQERELAELEARTRIVVEKMKQDSSHDLERSKSDTTLKVKSMDARKSDDEVIGARSRASDAEKRIDELQKQVTAQIDELQGHLHNLATASRKIRRGKDGRAEGVDILSHDGSVMAHHMLKRGKDGRAEGVDIVAPDGSVVTSKKVLRDKSGKVVGSQ